MVVWHQKRNHITNHFASYFSCDCLCFMVNHSRTYFISPPNLGDSLYNTQLWQHQDNKAFFRNIWAWLHESFLSSALLRGDSFLYKQLKSSFYPIHVPFICLSFLTALSFKILAPLFVGAYRPPLHMSKPFLPHIILSYPIFILFPLIQQHIPVWVLHKFLIAQHSNY